MESGGGGKAATRVSEKVCRRCKGRYEPSANAPGSCRFHPSFFVCRRHDDQKRYPFDSPPCSVAKLSTFDSDPTAKTRYYELRDGDPPYAAKFYDCCGAEDPDAPGCTTDLHRSYDDPDE
jgi:hypothetical protein